MATLTVAALPIDSDWRALDPRVVQAVQQADMLIAEERRSALRLLAACGARDKDFLLLNEHSDDSEISVLAAKVLAAGNTIFVSDAGTPCVADPDYRLVDACIKLGVEIKAVPGACSITAALSVSGFPADTFIFLGFPPKNGKERQAFFKGLTTIGRTAVFLERPYSMEKTLVELAEHNLDISISAGLGGTEEFTARGSAKELAVNVKPVKAPFAIVIRGKK